MSLAQVIRKLVSLVVPALAMGVDHVEFHGREACERAAHGVVLDSHAHGWFASATCWPLGDK